MKKIFSIFLIISLFFISCSKNASTGLEADLTNPLIKIVYPQDVPVLPAGFPLCIKVQVSDNRSLVNVWVEITDGHGYRKDYPVNGKSIEITEKYIAPAGVTGDLTANFFAIDESGNTSMHAVKFVMDN